MENPYCVIGKERSNCTFYGVIGIVRQGGSCTVHGFILYGVKFNIALHWMGLYNNKLNQQYKNNNQNYIAFSFLAKFIFSINPFIIFLCSSTPFFVFNILVLFIIYLVFLA